MTCTRTRLVTGWAAAGLTLSLLAAACTGPASAAHPAGGTPPAAAARPQVRVNQVGYPLTGPKAAYVMLARPAASVRFTVAGPAGAVFRGVAGRGLGAWNRRYRAVYRLDFSRLTRPGRYRVTVTAGGAAAASPSFAVAPPAALYRRLVLNAVRYFTSERDGADVLHSVLSREPANLTDAHATVYAAPRYSTDGNDTLLAPFRKIGGPVDVAGGCGTCQPRAAGRGPTSRRVTTLAGTPSTCTTPAPSRKPSCSGR